MVLEPPPPRGARAVLGVREGASGDASDRSKKAKAHLEDDPAHAPFAGFVGRAASSALKAGSAQRARVVATVALREAHEGGGAFSAWALDLEGRKGRMREALAAAVRLATPGLAPSFAPGAAALPQAGGRLLAPAALSSDAAPSVDAACLAAYGRTLALLRAADGSGLWPANSLTRARIIANAPTEPATATQTTVAGAKAKTKTKTMSPSLGGGNWGAGGGGSDPGCSNAQSTSTSTSSGSSGGVVGGGGTFAVGSMPPPLEPPLKANAVFLDLMEACFELEAALLPHRPPSSTIAINRRAQFTPHTDSGSGAGQSSSAIVALGDFTGGALVVEGEVREIRYRPLEFNGWTQRHWTLPFAGERFSLVWFTPRGCEGKSGLDLCRDMRAATQEAGGRGDTTAALIPV